MTNQAYKRAGDIIRKAKPQKKPKPAPKHLAPPAPPSPRRKFGWAIATIALLGMLAGGGWLALIKLDGPSVTPAAVSAEPPVSVATPEQEQVFLSELRYSKVPLTPEQEQIAVDIAREHVKHNHLNGMRTVIEADVRRLLPHLDDQQVGDTRQNVEHHFQRVTGRKQ